MKGSKVDLIGATRDVQRLLSLGKGESDIASRLLAKYGTDTKPSIDLLINRAIQSRIAGTKLESLGGNEKLQESEIPELPGSVDAYQVVIEVTHNPGESFFVVANFSDVPTFSQIAAVAQDSVKQSRRRKKKDSPRIGEINPQVALQNPYDYTVMPAVEEEVPVGYFKMAIRWIAKVVRNFIIGE